ncbi:YeeE/YedE family protein [Lishizhenia sp.]|uniref:YeeE/YedE family protein n=1 Tax=Lishizhenia sp. TaxID=2497594 RepID=UPI00299F52C3|nr:DUF6691 family protein [Lishizhenia sp.]MDX1444963.1 DUF6691 family protein [Lishizhenia sp.]
MKRIAYLAVGVIFGIVMSKAEIVSWYRIYEMFRFESFHMYGVIGSAVILGMIAVQLIKKKEGKTVKGDQISFSDKNKSIPRYLIGGTLFGLGWAMTGACPGPMFVLLGQGVASIGIVIISAVFGTFLYGALRNKLPH